MVRLVRRIVRCLERKNVEKGIVYIYLIFNNIIVIIIDLFGNVIVWVSVGICGFLGIKKGILFVVQFVVEKVVKMVMDYGMRIVEVYVKGLGVGREVVIRVFQVVGFEVIFIKDVILILYNGCRLLKRRRV